MKIRTVRWTAFLAAAWLAGPLAVPASGSDMPEAVKSLIASRCAVCHKGKFPPQGLNLEAGNIVKDVLDIPSREKPDLKLVDSANPESSYLLMKITGQKGISGKRMPASGAPLTEDEIKLLTDWVMSFKAVGPSGAPDFGGGGPDSVRAAQASPAVSKAGSGKPAFENPPFWGVRLISLPTGMTMDKGDFLLRISHRMYPAVKTGYSAFWGLDGPAVTFFSMGYGFTDKLGVTLARTGLFQDIEASATWLVLEQGENPSLPFSASVNGGFSWITQKQADRGLFNSKNFKLNAQVVVSHQFNQVFSVLVAPCYSSNVDHWNADSQGTFALGMGGRAMVWRDFSFLVEWIPVLAGFKDVSNGWGFGIEKKIGGHVFQVYLTNSVGLTSDQFIGGGDFRLSKGEFRIGFTIFRTF